MIVSWVKRNGNYSISKALRRGLLLLLSGAFVCPLAGASSSRNEEYLTDEEIEQMRDAQEPPFRMSLLTGFLNKRFEKVRAARATVDSVQGEMTEEISQGDLPGEKEAQRTPGSDNAKDKGKKEPQKTFGEILDVYLSCLDEVSSNLENARTLPLDPKDYMKSLNKLDESLRKQIQWFKALETKTLKKAERETTEEIKQAQGELAEDVEKAIGQLGEQIKKMKDAKKAGDKKE